MKSYTGDSLRIILLVPAAMLFAAAVARTQTIPATGLCNTGLTAATAGAGCTTSLPVTPVNPVSGGPTVDGNWQLGTPYPSQTYTTEAPDPCSLTSFGPAWVDTPYPLWFNPDGLSQYISPQAEAPSTGGWYVYRTAVAVPAATSGSGNYLLTAAGHLLADDQVAAIVLQNANTDTPGCKVVALPSLTNYSRGTPGDVATAWNPFGFKANVRGGTTAYLYVVVFNVGNPNVTANYTALRVEFTSASFTPE